MPAPALTVKGSTMLLVSIGVCFFWWLTQFAFVYQYAFTGALYELLSLPMMAMLFVWPIWLIYRGFRTNWQFRNYVIICILVHGLTIVKLLFFPNY